MRIIVVFLLPLLFSSVAQAIGLPSSISGGFTTPERACRLVLARHQTVFTQISITCLRWADGLPSSALYQVYTPNQCPDGNSTILSFSPRPVEADKASTLVPGARYFGPAGWLPYALEKNGEEFFVIRGYDEVSGALSVLIGADPSALANGFGVPQTWRREVPVPSPAPYTCTFGPTLRFRVFGR